MLLAHELDDKFDGSPAYETGMVSLIWAVHELNANFYESRLGCKILVQNGENLYTVIKQKVGYNWERHKKGKEEEEMPTGA